MKLLLTILTSTLLLLAGAAVGQQVFLKADDTISVDVYQESDLRTTTRVLKSGEIVLPLVGAIKISGLTLEDATKAVTDAYAKDYLVSPKVTLTINHYSQEYFSVLGAVGNPGQFLIPLSGKVDLPAAMASAGGPARDADPSGVTIVRASGGTATYTTAVAQSDASVFVYPGDRITVRKSNFANKSIQLMGQVNRPGAVGFPVSGKLDLVEAILQAGGVSQMGNPKKVKIIRGDRVLGANFADMLEGKIARFQLEPGDIVEVQARIW